MKPDNPSTGPTCHGPTEPPASERPGIWEDARPVLEALSAEDQELLRRRLLRKVAQWLRDAFRAGKMGE